MDPETDTQNTGILPMIMKTPIVIQGMPQMVQIMTLGQEMNSMIKRNDNLSINRHVVTKGSNQIRATKVKTHKPRPDTAVREQFRNTIPKTIMDTLTKHISRTKVIDQAKSIKTDLVILVQVPLHSNQNHLNIVQRQL